ncbi:hypothetical protein Q757_09625 [Oenococcus alcoholitolerans]|uniref:Uncharacterized protein n=1 Tax=Oenococcus alcoholitolerans TaxID=931074 RepID=A0ABR4XNR7_9LACO|nr:hypothetical protein Q757_09625 [Oenococcus alcoholitolerans]
MSKKLSHDAITLLNALENAGYDFYGKGRSDDVYLDFCKQHGLYDLAVSIRQRFDNLEDLTPEVIKMYMNGSSINYIAESFQISTRTIGKIVKITAFRSV